MNVTCPTFSKPLRTAISFAISLSILLWNLTKNELVNTLLVDDATNVVNPRSIYNHTDNIAMQKWNILMFVSFLSFFLFVGMNNRFFWFYGYCYCCFVFLLLYKYKFSLFYYMEKSFKTSIDENDWWKIVLNV